MTVQSSLFEHPSRAVDIEVAPSLKVVLSSATPVRHNTFDTACRISEAIAGLSEKSFIIEISGPGVEGLPLEDRMSLLGYLSFLSGRNAVIEPDQTFLNYLNHYGGTEAPVPYSDKNAPLLDTIPVTLAKLRSPIYSSAHEEARLRFARGKRQATASFAHWPPAGRERR